MVEFPPRRWFRFSLKTLFVLVTVSGVWLGVHLKWINDRHAWLAANPPGQASADIRLVGPPRALGLLGESGVALLHVRLPIILDGVSGRRTQEEQLRMFELTYGSAEVRQACALFPEASYMFCYFADGESFGITLSGARTWQATH